MYYLCSENKGADQLCSYCTADLRLCFRMTKIQFSHDAAKMMIESLPEEKKVSLLHTHLDFDSRFLQLFISLIVSCHSVVVLITGNNNDIRIADLFFGDFFLLLYLSLYSPTGGSRFIILTVEPVHEKTNNLGS